MKTIGLIGGMSWESTSEYYRIINEEIKPSPGCDASGNRTTIYDNFLA